MTERATISGNEQEGYKVQLINVDQNEIKEAWYFGTSKPAIKKYTELIHKTITTRIQKNRKMQKMLQ